jgi:hypothetical protein
LGAWSRGLIFAKHSDRRSPRCACQLRSLLEPYHGLCCELAHPSGDVGEQVCPLAEPVEDFPTTLLLFWVDGSQRGLDLVKNSPLLVLR